jgi:recombination protein RecT
MTNAVTGALVARQEQVAASPRKLVEQYTGEFESLLPEHVKSAMFVRSSAGALRTGRMTNGEFDLEVAARNNPQAFINALRTAARLGLTPGSEEFYLTVVKNKGRAEILGIVGYMGYIELMYRAGAVATVIVDTVHVGEQFQFVRGRDEQPTHIIDWGAERGDLYLVYAYAKMKDGSTSYVVVLNQYDIKRIKAKSASAKSDYSPWNTDERAMWLKSAVRQLRKWVPTSASYLTTQLRAAHEATQPGILVPDAPQGHQRIPEGHQVQIDDPDEVVDAEVVEEPTDAAQEPVQQAPEPAPPAQQEPVSTAADGGLITRSGVAGLSTLFGKIGAETPDKKRRFIKEHLGIDVESLTILTVGQANLVIEAINKVADSRKRTAEEPEDVPLPDEPE